MENGHWSIPFSVAFVVKKLENFSPEKCSVDIAMTVILRMKFTGIPNMKTIMDWVIANCKLRMNEVEGKIIDES